MKIIKPGNLERLKHIVEFNCEYCGCVFQAEKGEYKHQYSQRENEGWYEIQCPTCGGWCTKKDK